MIVPVFNYHSSIITIMGKSNKALYINIPSNFRYVLKLIQNRLNRLHSPISPVLTVSRIFTGIIECDSQQSSDTQQIRII